MTLAAKGRIEFSIPADVWIERCEKSGVFQFVPLDNTICRLSTSLGLHGDPADRFISATSVYLGATLRVCAEINSQIFVSRRMPNKARKHRNMDIFRVSATMLGVMHSPPKCEVIYAWALITKDRKLRQFKKVETLW